MGWSNREGLGRRTAAGARRLASQLAWGLSPAGLVTPAMLLGVSLTGAGPLAALAPAAAIVDGRLPAHGIALAIAFLIISLGIHEAAHGWVALHCGDPTARDLGRITLNPIPHIDPFMTIILPTFMYMTSGFIFGGAKPVPVNYHRLRHPLRDMALVAMAGPASNLLLAVIFLAAQKAALQAGYQPDQLLPLVLEQCVIFNLILTVFNLFPIPPLDGSRVMAWLLPSSIRDAYVALERFGMILVIVFVFLVPGFNTLFRTGLISLYGLVDALTGGTWQ